MSHEPYSPNDTHVQEGRISANTPVVVLANRDKETMEASVKEALSHNSPLKVHTRSGNPALFSDLEVASAGDAKYVLFNKPVGSDVVIHDLKERVLTQTAAVQALEAERQPGVKVRSCESIKSPRLDSLTQCGPQVGNAAGDIRMIVNGYCADELENDALPGNLVMRFTMTLCDCLKMVFRMPGITIMPKGDFSRRLLSCSTAQPGLRNVYSQVGEACANECNQRFNMADVSRALLTSLCCDSRSLIKAKAVRYTCTVLTVFHGSRARPLQSFRLIFRMQLFSDGQTFYKIR